MSWRTTVIWITLALTAWSEVPDESILRQAEQLDLLIAQRQTREGVTNDLQPLIDDGAFLRRTTLILLGRIPTLNETQSFLSQPNHGTLVLEMLNSDEYASQEYRRWATRLHFDLSAPSPALTWLKSRIKSGTPYGTWSHDLFATHAKSELTLKANRSEVNTVKFGHWMTTFTGLDMACAACHDHPFDNYTQHQFFGLAAFMNGNGAIRLPQRYAYADAGPGEVVSAKTFFGPELELIPHANRKLGDIPEPWKDVGSELQFADWLLDPRTELFEIQAIDQTWQHVMGFQLVNPRDVLSGNKPSPLVERLRQVFRTANQDRRILLRILMATQFYQRAGIRSSTPNTRPFLQMKGLRARRLTSDEWKRSIAGLEGLFVHPTEDQPIESLPARKEPFWQTSSEIEKRVTGNDLAKIWEQLDAVPSDDGGRAAVNSVFLAILSRPPDEAERIQFVEQILPFADEETRNATLRRLIWSLLLTEEFAWTP